MPPRPTIGPQKADSRPFARALDLAGIAVLNLATSAPLRSTGTGALRVGD